MLDLFIRSLIIIVPTLLCVRLVLLLRKIQNPGSLSVWTYVLQFYEEQKENLVEFYTRKTDIDKMFQDAGIFVPVGIIRVFRDISIFLLLLYIHVQYFSNQTASYPLADVVSVMFLYVATMLVPNKPFPIYFILKKLKTEYDKKKNKEIFLLQQLILNEYSGQGENQTTQRIYYLFRYLIRFMNHIRPAMIKFLTSYNEDAYDRRKPFNIFAETVGTEEAYKLAEVLYAIDQSVGSDVQDLLKSQYEELKVNRQESYKSMMQDRGNIGYFITVTGVLMVIGLFMVMYYLEHQEMMNVILSN